MSLAPGLQQQRLPPDTSSQFTDESRSRFGFPCNLLPNRGSRLILLQNVLKNPRSRLVLPCTWSPNHGSRLIRRHNLLANRGVAFDFLAISLGSCLHPLPVVGAAPTSRGRKGRYTPNGGTIEDEEGGYRGYGMYMLVDTPAYESEQS